MQQNLNGEGEEHRGKEGLGLTAWRWDTQVALTKGLQL